ncbi:IdeS/Mac family cysteine endopeptidase [Ureaplasma miroungigenitalium]|uniref:IdeS/Mac family cysteine endopeptidase n=1 Tax=Ureaplasma miroungigenitalium TaxID=1042321 RepID=A0ABT3BN74_9BACT|nr:IdeS/Mac family cysteine endopeptidase [Ureaplasma miroungigenitalium]MCV3728693.1 IdeS/Mac family cysteine endopeptidase [Ureaplasma miroungigenitalium]MCV3734384.1 IdeS/Mac family cysteine endopeptidase [Ureaplasma miroungigenitalium]
MKNIKIYLLTLSLLLPLPLVSCTHVTSKNENEMGNQESHPNQEQTPADKQGEEQSKHPDSHNNDIQDESNTNTQTPEKKEQITKKPDSDLVLINNNATSVEPQNEQTNEENDEHHKAPETQKPTIDTTKIIPSLKAKVAQTIWVAGVNLNLSDFRKVNDPELEVYEYPLRNAHNEGWYDINKRLINGDWSLCSAIVATNWLHWWLDRNQEYIQKYVAQYPDKAIIKAGNIEKKLESINVNYQDENHYYDRSRIFDYFNGMFANRALWPDKLIDMFINGYKYSSYMTPNNESEYSPAASRGFFKDVFKAHRLTDVASPGSLEHFSETVTNWLKEGRALAVSFGSKTKGHIVTIWGADFDDNGNILALYISDSDNKSDTMRLSPEKEPERVGITRLRVDYSTGSARLSGFIEDGKGVNIWNLYSISDGKEYWKTFFENN